MFKSKYGEEKLILSWRTFVINLVDCYCVNHDILFVPFCSFDIVEEN